MPSNISEASVVAASSDVYRPSATAPSSVPHNAPASNGSWDWNCDGVITESEPGGASFFGLGGPQCTTQSTYANICGAVANSAPVCKGVYSYYHCQAANAAGNHCGEPYYYFDCTNNGTDCVFPGFLSTQQTDGCY